MSTITREFTKEQLQQIIETDHVQCGEASALARIALASLEAEPVCVIDQSNLDYLKSGSDADVWPASRTEMGDVLLYRAATPAPVSVPAAMEIDDDFDSAFEHGKAVGWNAYRAAMLQAEPVSNSDELPLDYLQGHKDGLEWAAQLAEANHPQTGDWLYDDPIDLARAISKGPDMPTAQAGNHTEQHLDMVDHSGDANKMVAGNSPVIQDGWVACSERIPDIGTEIFYFCQDDDLRDCGIVSSANFSDKGDAQLYVHADGYDLRFGVDITHWMPLPPPPLK
ncbi:DUF551 domain-containing protein [Enterobacter asburiae]|uniref:DUF551 domain-containing protein n=1 Tax=Enterobacter asburiae TaxID=61645 RepID=UPI00123943DC|nr:DUF551 domain-containing protein [Enterobacter asburiae]